MQAGCANRKSRFALSRKIDSMLHDTDTPTARLRPNRRQVGSLLLGTLAAGMTGAAAAQSPIEDVRIADFDWVDGQRQRPVPARLYWPNTTSQVRRVPLIVFSHGLGQARTGYSYLGRHWSSQGFASLHLQHVGSDSSVWAGNPLSLLDRIETAVQEQEAIARAQDLRFALDRFLVQDGGAFGDRIDPRRIVAAGHSYGANTTLIAVGARVVRDGRIVQVRDPRIRAGIVISAPPFYGEHDLRAVLSAVEVPTLHVTATEDVINLPGRTSPFQDRLAVYEAIATPRKALAVFQGGSHSIFTDRALTGGASLNPQVKGATASGALAFLDLAFQGDPEPLRAWSASFGPILAVAPHGFRETTRKPSAASSHDGGLTRSRFLQGA
jgi:predicted dienelactone hydrolase